MGWMDGQWVWGSFLEVRMLEKEQKYLLVVLKNSDDVLILLNPNTFWELKTWKKIREIVSFWILKMPGLFLGNQAWVMPCTPNSARFSKSFKGQIQCDGFAPEDLSGEKKHVANMTFIKMWSLTVKKTLDNYIKLEILHAFVFLWILMEYFPILVSIYQLHFS